MTSLVHPHMITHFEKVYSNILLMVEGKTKE